MPTCSQPSLFVRFKTGRLVYVPHLRTKPLGFRMTHRSKCPVIHWSHKVMHQPLEYYTRSANLQLYVHPVLPASNWRRGKLLLSVQSPRPSKSVLLTSSGGYRTRSYSHGNYFPMMLYQRQPWMRWAWWGCLLCRERWGYLVQSEIKLLLTRPSSRNSSWCWESNHHWKVCHILKLSDG